MRITSTTNASRTGAHRAEGGWGAALAAMFGSLLLVVGLVVPTASVAHAQAPSTSPTAPSWTPGACAPNDLSSVTMVVDFQDLDTPATDPIIRCVSTLPADATGVTALQAAGLDPAGTRQYGLGFVCRILGRPSQSEVLFGTYSEACVRTPPSRAYWSYWTAQDGGDWNYSNLGASGNSPIRGGFEGWSFSKDKTASTNPAPRVMPDLASLATSSSSSQESLSEPSSATTSSESGPSSASLTSASASSTSESSSGASTSSTSESSSESSGVGTTSPSSGSTVVSTTPTTSAAAPTLPTATPTTDAHTLAAAHWLGEQLANAPNGLFGNADYPDWGLTIDALLALSAAGVGGDLIAATAARIQNSGEDYVGEADATSSNFARIAKTALALQVAGLDPTSFPSASGPRNLIAELRGSLNADGSFGDSDFAFVHALAIYALARTPEGVPASAVSWLESTQCTTTGDENFGAYSYDGTDPCTGVDADGTALAIQALAAGGVQATDPSIKDAAAYLLSIQGANGGVPSSFGGINTNNTGLAAQALDRVRIAPTATARMTTFVSTLQVQCATLTTTGKRFSSKDLGAIAYMNDGGFDSPITAPDFDNRDQWIRATTQAIFAYHLPSFDRITARGAQPAVPPAPECAPPATSSAPTSATPTTPIETSTTATTTTNPTAPTTSQGGGSSSAAPVPGSLSLSAETVAAGGSVIVTITGSFLKTGHRVELHSTPVPLGTLVTDDDGNGSLTVRIPADTAVGQHEIVVAAGGSVTAVGLIVTAANTSSATPSTSMTLTAPVTTPVDNAGNPLPNTGVSEGLRTLLVIGGLLLSVGAVMLMLGRRRIRSGSGTRLS